MRRRCSAGQRVPAVLAVEEDAELVAEPNRKRLRERLVLGLRRRPA